MMRLAEVIHFIQAHRYRKGIFFALVVKFILMIVIGTYCYTHKNPPPLSPLLEESWGEERL